MCSVKPVECCHSYLVAVSRDREGSCSGSGTDGAWGSAAGSTERVSAGVASSRTSPRTDLRKEVRSDRRAEALHSLLARGGYLTDRLAERAAPCDQRAAPPRPPATPCRT